MQGDWVLVHVGFAMSKISEEQALDQLRTLSMLGEDAGRAGRSARIRATESARPMRNAGCGERTLRLAAMKYVDEFREAGVISKAAEEIRRLADPRAAVPVHGSVRRPHARHLSFRAERSSAAEYRADSWSWLPGLRAADGTH